LEAGELFERGSLKLRYSDFLAIATERTGNPLAEDEIKDPIKAAKSQRTKVVVVDD